MPITRRALIAGGAAVSVSALAAPVRAAAPVELRWGDLIPGGGGRIYETLIAMGVVQHGQALDLFGPDAATGLVDDYNGRRVSIAGYAIPLDFEAMEVAELLLVPYVSACIHVPPPPPNQLIVVTTDTPYALDGLFEPIRVTGLFDRFSAATDLAEVGYQIAAERIEPYE